MSHARALSEDYDYWRETMRWLDEQDEIEREAREDEEEERRRFTTSDPGPRVHGGVRP